MKTFELINSVGDAAQSQLLKLASGEIAGRLQLFKSPGFLSIELARSWAKEALQLMCEDIVIDVLAKSEKYITFGGYEVFDVEAHRFGPGGNPQYYEGGTQWCTEYKQKTRRVKIPSALARRAEKILHELNS